MATALAAGLLAAGAPAAAPPPAARVLFDQGHHNVQSLEGEYRGLAELLAGHGFTLATSGGALSREALAGTTVLFVAMPRGAGREASMEERARPAFSDAEVEAVHAWVEAGGALLLVTDHPPIGSAAAPLARRFGVEGGDAFTEDPAQGRPARESAEKDAGVAWAGDGRDILFSRADGSLADHPVTAGAGPGDRVSRVATFLGQSLAGPPGSVSFLRLAPTAVDRSLAWAGDHWAAPSAADRTVSAAGRSQGLAFAAGAGRVVVLGEAGMLGTRGLAPGARAPDGQPLDNAKLIVNLLRWLAGQLR